MHFDTMTVCTLSAALLLAACGGEVVVAPRSDAGSGGSGGAPAAAPVCDASVQVTVDGSLDGQHLHAAANSAGGGFGSDPRLVVTMVQQGMLFLRSPQLFGFDGPVESDLGWLRLPPSPGVPAGWLCSDESATVAFQTGSHGYTASFTWSQARRMGDCPGASLDGGLNIAGSFVDHTLALSGTVAGTSFAMPVSGYGEGSGVHTYDLGSDGFMEILPEADPPIAYLILPRTGPDPGALYCASVITPSGYHFALQGLSRVGSCAEGQVAGSLGVCVTTGH